MVDLRNAFLKHLTDINEPIIIFLNSGVKLSGHISSFGQDCLTLARDGITQLVMLHAVATVMPSESFSIHDIVEGE